MKGAGRREAREARLPGTHDQVERHLDSLPVRVQALRRLWGARNGAGEAESTLLCGGAAWHLRPLNCVHSEHLQWLAASPISGRQPACSLSLGGPLEARPRACPEHCFGTCSER